MAKGKMNKEKLVRNPVYKEVKVNTFWGNFNLSIVGLLVFSLITSTIITLGFLLCYSSYVNQYEDSPVSPPFSWSAFWAISYFTLLIVASAKYAEDNKEVYEEEVEIGYTKIKGGSKR